MKIIFVQTYSYEPLIFKFIYMCNNINVEREN